MKQHLLCAVLLLLSALSNAKVADFNELISENSKSQKQLHSEVKLRIQESRETAELAAGTKSDRLVIVEGVDSNYAVPTNKDLLVFEKEKNFHRHSEKKQMKRFATEISNLDQD